MSNFIDKHKDKFIIDEVTGCWNWFGSRTGNGYPQISKNGTNFVAHRYFYEEIYGAVEEDIEVHHKCRNRRCVNINHLQALPTLEHRRLERRPRVLTITQRNEIRKRGKSRRNICSLLGREYGVDHKTIRKIIDEDYEDDRNT